MIAIGVSKCEIEETKQFNTMSFSLIFMARRKVWYPDKEFVIRVHDRMIEEFADSLDLKEALSYSI